jgi:hypothetical protein
MRTEESEGIRVARGEEGSDLRVEAWIAGSGGRSVVHGWALLGQVDDLQELANAARSGAVSIP